MQYNYPIKKAFLLLLIALSVLSCDNDKATERSDDPKISKLKLPADFKVDHLYTPSEHDHGSWVSMAFDDRGRLIASDNTARCIAWRYLP